MCAFIFFFWPRIATSVLNQCSVFSEDVCYQWFCRTCSAESPWSLLMGASLRELLFTLRMPSKLLFWWLYVICLYLWLLVILKSMGLNSSSLFFCPCFQSWKENPARANGHIFNVGNPNNEVTVRELAQMMTEVCHWMTQIRFVLLGLYLL
jgi:hypothetical protein